ncbi:hypothetical protein Acsp03_71150 [Actinomadura sp. NBRC 104412]|uniref:helix-turn-helix domain-containing protein n=1 Tax=Actinomadura sp. NBRC 104412 TaxID=3032203 RepID=UPI00249FE271|nr:helix-turn-helix transcriptional regulator [Actinomadura sp. NBRC 104412]GLZ09649.1 hypothetical protein Acsp03_71150 [Actinomadura sp. NBRC 104412]
MPPNPPLDPKASLWNLIAVYLRLQREHRGLSGESLGRIIGASKATVSKIENGKDRLNIGHAKLLDAAWETGNPELLEGGLFEWLIFFASLGHRPQWGQEYARFEQASRIIRIFEPSRMTGLLQTPDYARALLAKAGVADPEPVVAERMERKAVLDRAFVTVTLSEAALRWPVGSPAIMREQLAHVLELAERPNIVVHAIPATFDTGAYLGLVL